MTETDADEGKTAPAGAGVAVRQGAVRQDRRGRWTRHGRQLTEKQALFVSNFVSNGGDKRSAVVNAGYTTAWPVQVASQMLAQENIREALRQEREKYIGSDLAGLALNTMRDLMADDSTPASTRFQAAKWSLETAGHGTQAAKHNLPDPDKPLSSMSLSELETFISAGREALDRPTIEGEAQRLDSDQEDITDIDADEVPDSDNAQDSAQIEDMLKVSD